MSRFSGRFSGRYQSRFSGRLASGGNVSGALSLLGSEPQGLAIDGTDLSMAIRDTGTPANNFSGDPNSKLTYSSPATKWILRANGNYQSGTTLRTEYDVSGVALGVRIEEARTNVILHNRDLTNAAWTKTNATAAKDQIGIDGVANSASSLAATAANGTCLQAITLGSSARYQSAFVKRLAGSGTINMTMDNGTTWTAIAVTSSWLPLEIPTQTLANPTVGFRIVTSGDAIAIDMVGNENGVFRTSPIATTTASVTRAADNIYLPTSLYPYSSSANSFWGEMDTADLVQANCMALNSSGTYGVGNGALFRVLNSAASDCGGNATSVPKAISPALAANSMIKIGGAIKTAGTTQAATNRGQISATNATLDWNGTSNRLQFGVLDGGGTQAMNGHLKRLVTVPRYDLAWIEAGTA